MIEINGWIKYDSDSDSIGASPYKNRYTFDISIAKRIADEAEHSFELTSDLGGQMGIIPEANVQIYYTKEECTFEEAEQMFLEQMDGIEGFSEDGKLTSTYYWVGYSEYTITGFSVDEFSIGGHDLEYEISGHVGEYINMRIS